MVQNHKTVIWNFDFFSNPPDGYLLAFQGSTGLWIPVMVPTGIQRVLSPVFSPGNTTPPGQYQLLNTDDFVRFDPTTGPMDGYLPSTPIPGKGYTIADVTGHAASNNITVVATGPYLINGAGTFNLTMNNQTVTVVFNGINWSIV